MKQQVNPIVAVVAGIITVAVVGLLIYFVSNRTPPPSAPIQPSGSAPVIRNVSPDQQIQMRMQQMQQNGQGGQPAPGGQRGQGGADSG